MKWLRWLFWVIVYWFRREPRTLEAFLVRVERCRPPWWTFKPSVWHNDEGREWHVYLSDESTYTDPNYMLRVDLHRIRETEEVVGFDVYDKDLQGAISNHRVWFVAVSNHNHRVPWPLVQQPPGQTRTAGS